MVAAMPDHPAPHPAPGAAAPRFPVPVDAALRAAGWRPGRWDMARAETWADALRGHMSPAGHLHTVFPAAVEAWAEFGGLRIAGTGPGRAIAPATLRIDPLPSLHLARTLSDLGRALDTEVCPLGVELQPATDLPGALLAIDTEGRVYGIDHSGDWFLGGTVDGALTTLLTGTMPARLSG
jgi:SUKH-3 immunity protein